MRLLIFSPYYVPHVGGVESFVSELNQHLLRRPEIERITILAPALPAGAPERESDGPSLQIIRYPAYEPVPNFPVPCFWSVGFWRLLRQAGLRRHDLFICHTRFFISSLLALACARAVSRPLLHVEHGSDHVQMDSPRLATVARLYDRLLGRLVLRGADSVLAVSAASAAFVRRLAQREAKIVHRGMSRSTMSGIEGDPQIRRQGGNRIRIGYVGRLIDGKGTADLLRAFATLPGGGSVLFLIGEGPEREALELLAQRLRISDSVIFLGMLPPRRALQAMAALDVIVNPSYSEGLPTTVLEAAFLGRAVVATDVGGTSEIIEDETSGLLFSPRDVSALAAALTRLLESPELRQRLGGTARELVQERFEWESTAERLAEIFLSLLPKERCDQPRYQST